MARASGNSEQTENIMLDRPEIQFQLNIDAQSYLYKDTRPLGGRERHILHEVRDVPIDINQH